MFRVKSQEDAQRRDILGFIRMLVRLNDSRMLYAEFEPFKSHCLSISSEHIKHRTESVLNQEDAAILAERNLIIHSISLFILRH